MPLLSNLKLPVIDRTFSVDLTPAAASTVAVLVSGGTKLNIDFTSLGAPGCFLSASTRLLIPVSTGRSGSDRIKLIIPNNTALLGVKFRKQYMVVDPKANQLALVFSKGGEGTTGEF